MGRLKEQKMAYIAPKTRQISPVSEAAIKHPKGFGVLIALATIQGFVWLGVFARMLMWNTNTMPDASLTSIFTNTAFLRTSLGEVTIGDVSVWVERAVVLGLSLTLSYFAWRMHSRK
jgi:hypothetical protein